MAGPLFTGPLPPVQYAGWLFGRPALFVDDHTVKLEEKMGEEKAVKPKQTGMALEMDVIKKITHQLERLPRGVGAEARIMQFVSDWSQRRPVVALPPAPNGQLPLAAKDDGFPE